MKYYIHMLFLICKGIKDPLLDLMGKRTHPNNSKKNLNLFCKMNLDVSGPLEGIKQDLSA